MSDPGNTEIEQTPENITIQLWTNALEKMINVGEDPAEPLNALMDLIEHRLRPEDLLSINQRFQIINNKRIYSEIRDDALRQIFSILAKFFDSYGHGIVRNLDPWVYVDEAKDELLNWVARMNQVKSGQVEGDPIDG